MGTGPVEVELAAIARAGERREELAAEEAAHDRDGEQVAPAASGGDPADAVGGQPAAGDDAMQVAVEGERAGPGVQDRGDTEQASEPLGIAAQLEEGAGGSVEEEGEEKRVRLRRATGLSSWGTVKTTWKWCAGSTRSIRSATFPGGARGESVEISALVVCGAGNGDSTDHGPAAHDDLANAVA